MATTNVRTASTIPEVGPDKLAGRYSVFAVTCGAVFAVIYPFILNFGWQLFTYYPALGEVTLFNHPPSQKSDAMKWFGYVTTAAIVSVVAGLVVSLVPERILNRF
jgi:hypothetical protein